MKRESLFVREVEDWVLEAACRGRQDLFFPPDTAETRGERAVRETAAKRICRLCVVREECLTEALEAEERYGIWGGLTERERRRLRRSQHAPRSSDDTPGSGRLARLPAVVVRGRGVSSSIDSSADG